MFSISISIIIAIVIYGFWWFHTAYDVYAENNKYRITERFSMVWDCYFYTLDYKLGLLCIQIESSAGKCQADKWVKKYIR